MNDIDLTFPRQAIESMGATLSFVRERFGSVNPPVARTEIASAPTTDTGIRGELWHRS